ncbi:hypothetical protein OX283_003975 [Flavobacterium sp. SUN052]|uniref:hypothetical protein n=1 Tax=Flavobacterium sp. SUN052 TaxID=3002441 RepID=UPI00237EBEB6|nr:hypothetical protein [Flavobacterium sp. SUN052]MEC4003802.1 hypothetical protein [Flavobacterium sp. SUN052]
MKIRDQYNFGKIIVVIYFINAIIEVFAEFYSNKFLIYLTKPLIPFLLMVLYFCYSSKKQILFFIILFFSLITNLLFIPSNEKCLFYGVISFTFHRIFLLILIFKIVKIKDYVPFFLSTLPLLFIFFYLFAASDVPKNSYYLIVFHNLMAAVLGGVAISNYTMNDDKQNSLLLISVLLFLGLQLVVYIEKYYLTELHSQYLRPLAMTLNILAFFVFYKFVIESEKTIQQQ